MNNEFVVLDVFSGAGGLSEGFFRVGYRFAAHVEKDKYASMTLETRSIYHALKMAGLSDTYYDYITCRTSRDELLREGTSISRQISGGVINNEFAFNTRKKIISEIERSMKQNDMKKIDLIIGGPPCQPYSMIGRNRVPMDEDPRNYLYTYYLNLLEHFQPEIFIFENVPGIKSAKEGKIFNWLTDGAKKLGYSTDDRILNAQNFFVLQKRERVIFMGWKSKYDLRYPSFKHIEHNYTVSCLLNDLPPLNPGEGSDAPQEYRGPPTEYLKEAGLRGEQDVLIQHRARKHNGNDREIYRRAIAVWNNEHRRIRYDELPEKLKTHKNKKGFWDRFKVVEWDRTYSHSLMAHISRDGHYYIHPDVDQARSLTVREAARIQSFPDNFKFEGSRTSQYRQIGNAVPPLMSEGIAKEILKMLRSI